MAKRKRYKKEFKLQACKLVVEQGYTQREASERLGPTVWSIGQWIKKYRQSGDLPPEEMTRETSEELKQLREENSQLKLDNEI